MEKTTTVVPFRQVDSVDDPLTEIAREGARRMLAVVMGVEADAFVAQHSGVALPDGRQRVVRHGHGPMRRIQTGVGPLEVQRPKVRDQPTCLRRRRSGSSIVFDPNYTGFAKLTRASEATAPRFGVQAMANSDFEWRGCWRTARPSSNQV